MLLALATAVLATKLYPWGASFLLLLPVILERNRWIAVLAVVSVALAYCSIWQSSRLEGQTIVGSVVIDADGKGYMGLIPVCSTKRGVLTGSFEVKWNKYKCAVPVNVSVTGTPLDAFRRYMLSNLSKLESYPLVAGLVLGENLPLHLQEQAIKAGILHIFAISGLQTTFLLSYLWAFSRNRSLVIASGLGLLFIYGFMPSVIRSILMYFVMLSLPRGRSITVNGVAAVGLVGSLFDPLFLTKMSSLLSLIGAGAVVYWGNTRWSQVKTGLSLIPANLLFFHSFSLLGVPTALVVVPVFTVLYGFGLVYALVPLRAVGLTVDLIGSSLLSMVNVVERLPSWIAPNFSSTEIAILLLGIGLAIVLKSRLLAVGALILMLALPPKDQIVFVDVGQGSATLVQHGSSGVLVDTSNSAAVLRAVRWYGVRHLAVIISHDDRDHNGMLGQVRRSFQPTLLEPFKGDNVCFGGVQLAVMWPPPEFRGTDNERSRVVYTPRFNGLITSDIPSEYLPDGDYNFLTVPHHGAAMSQLNLNASVAVISVGRNSYGHPRLETIELLERRHIRVLRTDQCGDIVLDDLGIKCTRGLERSSLGFRF
ncbi:competence protein ComEC [Coprothermobacteraceae bacterium]|nr:competence protein ComEC [Coprothermobacteraceae bacterium]